VTGNPIWHVISCSGVVIFNYERYIRFIYILYIHNYPLSNINKQL